MDKWSEGIRFTLFGVPVHIRPSFWIVAVMLGLLGAGRLDPSGAAFVLSWVGVTTVSILIHELGHAAAMRFYRLRPSIELHSMGGLARYQTSRPLSRTARVVVSLAGPAAGFAAGLAALPLYLDGASGLPPFAQLVLTHWLWMNLAWSAFNLLPILPMDGGRVLEALMSKGRQGWRRARVLSVLAAAVVGLVALAFGRLYIAMMVAWFGGHSYSQL